MTVEQLMGFTAELKTPGRIDGCADREEALERLLDFRFPETPFIAEDALCLSERFLHKRAERALQCLQRQAKRPSSVSVP